MPRTKECDYCGDDIEPGTGTMLIHNNGSTTNFCSSKCENNADLGREARNLEWTDSERGADDAESTEDEDDAETETVEADTAAEDTEDSAADESASEEEEDSDEAEEAQA
jgi:large subunit ribosomal protein L24e